MRSWLLGLACCCAQLFWCSLPSLTGSRRHRPAQLEQASQLQQVQAHSSQLPHSQAQHIPGAAHSPQVHRRDLIVAAALRCGVVLVSRLCRQ